MKLFFAPIAEREWMLEMSKGEERIAKLLAGANYSFDREYIIQDVKGKKPLRYDFAVFDK